MYSLRDIVELPPTAAGGAIVANLDNNIKMRKYFEKAMVMVSCNIVVVVVCYIFNNYSS